MENEFDEVMIAIEREEKLKNYHGSDEVVYSDALQEYLDAKRENLPSVRLYPGFPSLDNSIKYFQGGELIVISGPTGHGKTLYCQTLTRNFFDKGEGSLWFTYEVPAHQFLRQFGDQCPIMAMPKELKENSYRWIEDRTIEACLKYSVHAMFLDNTHNVLNITAPNFSQVVGEFFKSMKRLAMKLNIPIFLLHHMTKTKLDDGENFDNNLLRDSSMVAQTADTVMFVWRDKDPILKRNQGYIKVTKNREFGVFNHMLETIKIGNFLEELTYRG